MFYFLSLCHETVWYQEQALRSIISMLHRFRIFVVVASAATGVWYCEQHFHDDSFLCLVVLYWTLHKKKPTMMVMMQKKRYVIPKIRHCMPHNMAVTILVSFVEIIVVILLLSSTYANLFDLVQSSP